MTAPSPAVATRPRSRERSGPTRETLIAGTVVGLGALLLCWSRLSFLDTSLWHDEANTVLYFVDRGPSTILFGEYATNNHVLFSLLSWATTWQLGRFEAAYRIWSVIPGLVAVAVVGWWAWRRLGQLTGAAVVILLTISPLHLELVPQARGYGLGFLVSAGLLIGAARACDDGRVSDVIVMGAFGFVGIWTLSQMVLPFLATAAVVFVARRELRRAVVVVTAAVGAASVLVYSPLLTQMVEQSHKDPAGTAPLPWYGWATAPVDDLGQPTLAMFLPDRLTAGDGLDIVLGVVCVVLAGLGAWRLARRGEWALMALLLAPVLGTYVLLVAARVWFIPRFGSFLLVQVVVLFAIGILELWELISSRGLVPRMLAITTATALVLVGATNVVDRARQLPTENFKLASQIVRESGIDNVVTNSRSAAGLWHYLGRQRVSVREPEALSRQFCRSRDPLVFIDHNYSSTPDPSFACLERRGAVRIHVPQEGRGSMDIWILTQSR